ncbi:MAG: hypothetical protein WC401_10150 [Bacteroidales bacterium]
MKTTRFMGMFGALLLASLNPGASKEVAGPHFRGYALGGYNPIYIPRRGKFKGYMRENKRCSFNKNR